MMQKSHSSLLAAFASFTCFVAVAVATDDDGPVPHMHWEIVSGLDREAHGCMRIADVGNVSAHDQKEYMLWWLPVGRMQASAEASGRLLTLYSPLESSKHGKGSFQLAFSVKDVPADACVVVNLKQHRNGDGTTVQPVAPSAQSHGGDYVDLEVQVEAGSHVLHLAVLASGGSGSIFCEHVTHLDQCDSLDAALLEMQVSFEVFAESIKKVQVHATFPPMDLTCRNAYAHHVEHLCRSAPASASEASFYLRLLPWTPDIDGSVGREWDQCFLLQAFALRAFARDQGDAGARDEGAEVAGVRVEGLFPATQVHSSWRQEVKADEGGKQQQVPAVLVPGDGRPIYGCFAGTDGSRGGIWHVQVRPVHLRNDVGEVGDRVWEDAGAAHGVPIQVAIPRRHAGGTKLARWREHKLKQKQRDGAGSMASQSGLPVGKTGETVRGAGGQQGGQGGVGEAPRSRAVVTVVLSADYLVGALVLLHSVREVCGRAGRGDGDGAEREPGWLGGDHLEEVELVLLVSRRMIREKESVERQARCAGVLVHWVEAIASPHAPIGGRNELIDTYTKLHVFNLTAYDKVVYLDADVLLYRCQLAALFHEPDFSVGGNPIGPAPPLRHQPHVEWDVAIGTSLMVVQPERERFQRLLSQAASAESFDGADRGVIHTLLPHYRMLSPHHVAWRRTAVLYKALWADDTRQVGAVDFTGRPKPWEAGSLGSLVDVIDKGNYWPLIVEWWSAYFRMTRTLPLGAIATWKPACVPCAMDAPDAETRHVALCAHDVVEDSARSVPPTVSGEGGVGGLEQAGVGKDDDGTKTWLERYLAVEQRSEEGAGGEVGVLVYKPGYYQADAGYSVFKTRHPIGLGNRMVQVASAVVLALATQRRLLIDWHDPLPLTAYLRPSEIDWDWDAFLARHPAAARRVRCLRGEGKGGVSWCGDERYEVVVNAKNVADLLGREGQEEECSPGQGQGVDGGLRVQGRPWMVVYSPDKLCPACPLLFNVSGADGEAGNHRARERACGWRDLVAQWRRRLPRDQFFFLLGEVLRSLFVLSPSLQLEFDKRWGDVAGRAGGGSGVPNSIAVQIRRGLWHVGSKGAANDKGLLSDEGEALLLTCARKLARNRTRYFLVTDDVSARQRVAEGLAPHDVVFLDAPLVHSGLEGQGDDGQRAVFLDWWVLGETQDAVLSDSSSFGYSAASRAAHWGDGTRARELPHAEGSGGSISGLLLAPVTVWNSDVLEASCSRRVWAYCKRNCHTSFINAAEVGFSRYPGVPLA